MGAPMSAELQRAAAGRQQVAERVSDAEARLKLAMTRLKAANEAHKKAHKGLGAFQEEYRGLVTRLVDDPLSATERITVVDRANELLHTFANYKLALQHTASERGTASQQVNVLVDRVDGATRALLALFPTIEELVL